MEAVREEDSKSALNYSPVMPRSGYIIETDASVSFVGVSVPKGKGGSRIPDKAQYSHNTLTSRDLRLMQRFAVALELNQPMLVEGGSGLGKTEIAEMMCAYLNKECYYANCHEFTPDVLIGSMTVKPGTETGFGWIDGVVIKAIREGGVLFLDEYNFMNGETRGRLHEILDAILRGKNEIILVENNGEIVAVHPNFRLVAAQNPPGDSYLDREVLDPAQFTRFMYVREPSEIPKDLMYARTLGVFGLAPPIDPETLEILLSNKQMNVERLKLDPRLLVLVEKYLIFEEKFAKLISERRIAADQPQPLYLSFQRDFNRILKFTAQYYNGDITQSFQRAVRFYYQGMLESAEDKKDVGFLIAGITASPDEVREVDTKYKRANSEFPPAGIVEFDDSVTFLGVPVTKGEGGQRTPPRERFRHNVITAYDLALMQKIAVCLDLNQPLLIEGGSGLGKSETAERMCAFLDRECYYANCHDLTPDVLIGTMTVSPETKTGFGWIDGIVIKAIRNGGVLFLDEYNFMSGETRGRLHEILDAVLRGKDEIILIENGGEPIEVHPNFRLVAAQNPPGEAYLDREILDPAQFSRFVIVKEPNEVPPALKRARALGALGFETDYNIQGCDLIRVSNPLSIKDVQRLPGVEGLMLDQYLSFESAIYSYIESGVLGSEQTQQIYSSFQREYNRVLAFTKRYYDGDLCSTLKRALSFYFVNKFESGRDRQKVAEQISLIAPPKMSDSRRVAVASRQKVTTGAFEAHALEMITDLSKAKVPEKYLVLAVTGLENNEFTMLREKNIANHPGEVFESLIGIDSDWSWSMRKRAADVLAAKGARSAEVKEALLLSIQGMQSLEVDRFLTTYNLERKLEHFIGIDSPEASLARNRADQLLNDHTYVTRTSASVLAKLKNDVMASITGIDAKEANSYRMTYRTRYKMSSEFASSLAFLDSLPLDDERRLMMIRVENIKGVLSGCAGVETTQSWRYRNQFKSNPEYVTELAESLAWCTSERAKQFRIEILSAAIKDGNDVSLIALSRSLTGNATVAAAYHALKNRKIVAGL